MKTHQIIKGIKERQSCKGGKNNRTHYRIATTNKDLNRYANNRYKLSLKEVNSYGIAPEIVEVIKTQWIKKGYDLKLLHKIGTIKALEILTKFPKE